MKLLLLSVELVLICFLLYRLYRLTKHYQRVGTEGTFLQKLEVVLHETFPSLVATIVHREISMFYFLFAKEKKPKEGTSYTYHKNVGYKGILIALLSVVLIESVGLFFLLHNWNPVVSYIHILLNLYGVVYLISDYRAIVQRPIEVTDHNLIIELGTRRQISVPFHQIASIQDGKNWEEDKKRKDLFKSVLLEFETPQFEIAFKESIPTKNLLGKMVMMNKLYVTVDDQSQFRRMITENMKNKKIGKSFTR
ncbi:hypothetical protein FZW96_13915 [Bacillus sp. BGMRC 2118]|nr:hypothetical protein FZW96_13915 [Bacillus sp. BGMRC 2118]